MRVVGVSVMLYFASFFQPPVILHGSEGMLGFGPDGASVRWIEGWTGKLQAPCALPEEAGQYLIH